MLPRFHKSALLVLVALPALAAAGEPASSFASMSQAVNPHTLNLELDFQARRRARPTHTESSALFASSLALPPLTWPRNSDMRARLLTPELKRAPLVGWIATNLYRSRTENGWCLEVDPGEGEYLVFYRHHLR
jgi:hypothetical protein